MSKYFNQTQQTAQAGNGDRAEAGTLDQLLGTVKEGNSLAIAVGDTRLEKCRKVVIARNGSNPQLISSLSHLNLHAAESYRALRTRLMRMQSGNGLHSIAVTSAVQGDGKTLTSANLALSFAQLSGFRTLLVDADLRTRGLSKLFRLSRSFGLGEILGGKTEYEEAICATELSNLYVAGAGNNTSAPPELLAGTRFKEFIGWASESFKLIIVDSPPLPTITDAELISAACDGVLMVVRALRTPRDLLEAAASQVDQKKLLGIVYNGADESNRYGSYRDYLQGHK
jgi:capsular exopolysaccharide synthesis family protein